MAEIADDGGGGHGHKGGKKRAKKGSTRVDMTPLVDLAFLLLTFFVLTSTFSDPQVMALTYPAKPDPNKPQPPEAEINNAITFLLSEDKIYYYENEFHAKAEKGKPATTLEETDFSHNGIRKLLIEKNSLILDKLAPLEKKKNQGKINEKEMLEEVKKVKEKFAKKSLKVLIKTDDKATCKNFIDLIDELKICNIGVIAPVDIMKSEQELIKAKAK
ncbi:MAG: biopolymer transporter ExbD [Flavobacteriia bacterium]|nr:biopolymer transporter ExbD [Flavobacteriia bacterium]